MNFFPPLHPLRRARGLGRYILRTISNKAKVGLLLAIARPCPGSVQGPLVARESLAPVNRGNRLVRSSKDPGPLAGRRAWQGFWPLIPVDVASPTWSGLLAERHVTTTVLGRADDLIQVELDSCIDWPLESQG